jgi:carbonyl reductase 1
MSTTDDEAATTTMIQTACSSGRVAIITGANKGIGYFIALQLGLSGLFSHLILGCRDGARADKAIASMRAELPDSVQVSFEQLTLGDRASHERFVKKIETEFGKADVLVNNAAIAYKGSDPTPFREQCKPTLDVNFRGTVDLTERLIPLLKKGTDARIINVASSMGGRGQLSLDLKQRVSSPDLTMAQLQEFVDDFEQAVLTGTHKEQGFGKSNYGMSKLAVIAATKIWARELEGQVSVACCHPGYCKTDMSSNRGVVFASDGAKNAVLPATMENPPNGAFFWDLQPVEW